MNHVVVARFKSQGYFPYPAIEKILQTRIPMFLNILMEEIGVVLPITAEVGFVGVAGMSIVVSELETVGPVHSDPQPVQLQINSITPAAQQALLLTLFEKIYFGLVQERRPQNLFGFPEAAR